MNNVSIKITKQSFDIKNKEKEVLDYLSLCLQTRAKVQKRSSMTDTFERTEQVELDEIKTPVPSEKLQKIQQEKVNFYDKYKDLLCYEDLS